MSIVFYCNWPNKQEWINKLKKKFIRKRIQIWPKISSYDEVEYAIVWDMPNKALNKFKNLKVIFSLGAGVDHLFVNYKLPKLPIVRIKDPIMCERMFNYITSQILNYQLKIYKYYESKKKKHWKEEFFGLDNFNLVVGILGMGYLGSYVGKNLHNNNYRVQGFKNSKTAKKNIYPVFYKKKQLKKFISTSDIIVNLLPNTKKTKNFVNKNFLNKMKKNSLLINAGRGSSVDENALSKHARRNKNFYAALDVFKEEPLKKNHYFWKQKNIFITPHIASTTNIESAVNQIFEIYNFHKKTGKLRNMVSFNKQY